MALPARLSCVCLTLTWALSAWSGESANPALLGASAFLPSPQRPLGWRGDGTGRYPGATPPTTWNRKRTGTSYETGNIRWATPLPGIGVSCPIVVGERIFLTTETADLVCIDQASGRIRWIRSHAECEGLSAAERMAEPAYAEKIAPLLSQLAKLDDDLVELLNAQLGAAGNRPPALTAALKRKRDLEKQIGDQQLTIDKKRYARNWAQAVFGFSGPTATSDGSSVCAFFTTGISVCYDLDGNRRWIAHGAGFGSEHGNFASPLLAGGRLMVWANELRAYDVKTGALAWTAPARSFNTYGSLFRIEAGGELVAGFQSGYFVRIRDGQVIWDNQIFGDAVPTPIVEGGALFAYVGYPRANDKTQGLRVFRIPPGTESGKLAPVHAFAIDWATDELPPLDAQQKKRPFDRSFNASPLLVDGLLYQLSEGGALVVHDAASGALVYRKLLPMRPRTDYWNWAGASASPTLAGKHIYLTDNQGTTVVITPGRQYQEVAVNLIEEFSADGKTQEQTVSTPVFSGTRMYWRTPGFLYCIGER